MREMLRANISGDNYIVNLSRYCFPRPFRSFFLVWEVETKGHNLDLEVRRESKGLIVGWHNIKLFAVPPSRHELVYAATPAFWHDLEISCWFFAATPLFSRILEVVSREWNIAEELDSSAIDSGVCGAHAWCDFPNSSQRHGAMLH